MAEQFFTQFFYPGVERLSSPGYWDAPHGIGVLLGRFLPVTF